MIAGNTLEVNARLCLMHIGDRIREKRKELGLTQAQVGEYFSISSVSVSEWERGISKPDQGKLEALARLLKTNVHYLVTGKKALEAVHIQPATWDSGRDNVVFIDPETNAAYDSAGNPIDYPNAEKEFQLPRGKYVPVVGIGRGGPDGYLSIDDHPAGDGDCFIYTYSSDPNAYGIRVRGDSMRPRIKSGEYIVAEPNVEAQPGDDVVVRLHDGRSMVKEFLWQRDDELSFGSVNNGYPPITLLRSEVESIHRVAAIIPRSSALVKPKDC
jgi:phage repressor protein C with HTH and peptisase S24 domain/DNA-binding XRE family transcriptional regulator